VLHWKKRWETFSSWLKKKQIGLPTYFLLSKLSFVKIALFINSHKKILISARTLPFPIFLMHYKLISRPFLAFHIVQYIIMMISVKDGYLKLFSEQF
jgi:hypothetical protein